MKYELTYVTSWDRKSIKDVDLAPLDEYDFNLRLYSSQLLLSAIEKYSERNEENHFVDVFVLYAPDAIYVRKEVVTGIHKPITYYKYSCPHEFNVTHSYPGHTKKVCTKCGYMTQYSSDD